MKRRKMHPVGKAIVLVATGILVGCAYYVFRYWDYPLASYDLDAAVKDYREAGLPWHAADLRPQVRPEENAAPLIERANRLEDSKVIDRAIKAFRAGKPAEALKIFEKYSEPLRLVALASQRPFFQRRISAKVRDSYVDLQGPDLQEWHIAVNLRATAYATLGKDDMALADLRTSFRLADLCARGPTIDSLGDRATETDQTSCAAMECANIWADKPLALERLAALLDEPRPPDDVEAAIKGDIFRELDLLRSTTDYEEAWLARRVPYDIYDPPDLPASMKERAFVDRLLRMWTEAQPVIHQYRSDLDEVAKRLDQMHDRFVALKSKSNALNSDLFRVPSASTVLQGRARLVTTRALVAALLIRSRTGHMPRTMAEIPGTWIDPFNGKSLQMAHAGEMTIIFSVGENKVADPPLDPNDDVSATYPAHTRYWEGIAVGNG